MNTPMKTRMIAAVLWVSTAVVGQASAQTVEYLHTDALGSIVAVTNGAGQVIERREYEPYGRQLAPTVVEDGPGYTGHVSDGVTGLDYMQQRYYDPSIGRFLSVDPVTADASTGANFNRYKYAANNPYRFVDPDGRQERAAEQFGDSYASMNQGEREGLARGLVGLVKGAIVGWAEMNSDPGGGGKAAVAGAVTKQTASALTRAKEIQGALKPATQGRVTTAVAETKEGVRVVGSSEGALRPAQRAVMQEGEVAAKGVRGTHAEVNAVNGAKAQGLTPTSVSPSRPACTNCQEAMKKMDIPIKDR